MNTTNGWDQYQTMSKHFYLQLKDSILTEWGDNWQDHFSLDIVNGSTGHELKFNGKES